MKSNTCENALSHAKALAYYHFKSLKCKAGRVSRRGRIAESSEVFPLLAATNMQAANWQLRAEKTRAAFPAPAPLKFEISRKLKYNINRK